MKEGAGEARPGGSHPQVADDVRERFRESKRRVLLTSQLPEGTSRSLLRGAGVPKREGRHGGKIADELAILPS